MKPIDASRAGKEICKTDPLPSLPGGDISSGSVLQNWADFSDASPTDAAERGALGVSGMRLYRTWLHFEQPMRVQELAMATGLSVYAVYYQLKKLREYGIAVGTSRGYWKLFPLSSPEEMDERIARPAGTFGKGARRHRMHSAERGRNAARIILRYRAKHDRAFELKEWKCPHCGHVVWHHRNVVPITCPRCHTP